MPDEPRNSGHWAHSYFKQTIYLKGSGSAIINQANVVRKEIYQDRPGALGMGVEDRQTNLEDTCMKRPLALKELS